MNSPLQSTINTFLRVDHLSHRYSRAWAIRDISLEIDRKGIFGLLGSNGAGKSTTMNIICGTLNQTQGEVTINGINVREEPLRAKKHIGFLPQVAPLYTDLTVKEYLLYCARLRSVDPQALPQVLAKTMDQCGITHMQNRLLKNLSGGYRQRAGIAQAIIHQPALVVLDEPTNGLDPLQIAEVRNLIREIAEERTVIFSSHILSEVEAICQQILMIEKGRLVFSDSITAFSNYVAPQSLRVTLRDAPPEAALLTLPGVSRVEQLAPDTFRIYYDGNEATCETFIQESARQQWRLVELTIEKSSVDEVFRQLSRKATDND